MNTKEYKSTSQNYYRSQQLGSEINALESAYCKTEEEAKALFVLVKERLLHVNGWKNIALGKFPEVFLRDAKGQKVNRSAQSGDFILFHLNATDSKPCVWAVVEQIISTQKEHGEVLQVIFKPLVLNKTSVNGQGQLVEANEPSIFQVRRRGKLITAEEIGRNDLPDADATCPMNKLRNSFIGWGAKLGTSYPIWKALLSGFLKKERLN